MVDWLIFCTDILEGFSGSTEHGDGYLCGLGCVTGLVEEVTHPGSCIAGLLPLLSPDTRTGLVPRADVCGGR